MPMILIIIIIIIFFGSLFYINRQRLKHLNQIAPPDLKTYKGINLVRDGHNPLQLIGDDPGHRIHYIGLDTHHRVLFPESYFGNHRRYYLTSTSFNSRLAKSNHARDNVRAAINIKKSAYSNDLQQHNHIFLTILKTDLSNAFKIELKAQQHDINVINQTFCLPAAQLKKLRDSIKTSKKSQS